MRHIGKDLTTGICFILIGGFFAVSTLYRLPIGSANSMGPGYFPLLLSGVLILIGLSVVILRVVSSEKDQSFGLVSWRSLILISICPILFALTVNYLGLAPALVLSCFSASMASRRIKLVYAIALTIGLTIFCLAVFIYGLGLPIPIFVGWITLRG
jgi:hypothetical protein